MVRVRQLKHSCLKVSTTLTSTPLFCTSLHLDVQKEVQRSPKGMFSEKYWIPTSYYCDILSLKMTGFLLHVMLVFPLYTYLFVWIELSK